MRFALVIAATVALGLGVTVGFASDASANGVFCCECDCHPPCASTSGSAAWVSDADCASGGAAGTDGLTCFTGFVNTEGAACEKQCNSLGCPGRLVDQACSFDFCETIQARPVTTPAPLFQPFGMILAIIAAGLAGTWSLLRRRKLS